VPPGRGLWRGENFWIRLTTASVQCLHLSERFFQPFLSWLLEAPGYLGRRVVKPLISPLISVPQIKYCKWTNRILLPYNLRTNRHHNGSRKHHPHKLNNVDRWRLTLTMMLTGLHCLLLLPSTAQSVWSKVDSFSTHFQPAIITPACCQLNVKVTVDMQSTVDQKRFILLPITWLTICNCINDNS